MAVTLSDNTGKRLQGLSTDDKPMDVSDGSTFHAIDTGEEYIFHDGMWEKDLRLIAALGAV
jgi:hypothetical protein